MMSQTQKGKRSSYVWKRLIDELKWSQFYTDVKNLITNICSQRNYYSVNQENQETAACQLLEECKISDASSDLVHQCENTRCEAKKFDIDELIGYGIGNFTSCLIARYQLALLMCLREDFQMSSGKCCVFDPVFTDEEQEILSKLDMELIMQNEEGKRRCTQKTLFFMPHCGKALYNNLLWANWSEDNLKHIIVIGNSFTNMIENTPHRLLQKTGNYIINKLDPLFASWWLPAVFPALLCGANLGCSLGQPEMTGSRTEATIHILKKLLGRIEG